MITGEKIAKVQEQYASFVYSQRWSPKTRDFSPIVDFTRHALASMYGNRYGT
jgi:hypothetical protein